MIPRTVPLRPVVIQARVPPALCRSIADYHPVRASARRTADGPTIVRGADDACYTSRRLIQEFAVPIEFHFSFFRYHIDSPSALLSSFSGEHPAVFAQHRDGITTNDLCYVENAPQWNGTGQIPSRGLDLRATKRQSRLWRNRCQYQTITSGIAPGSPVTGRTLPEQLLEERNRADSTRAQ